MKTLFILLLILQFVLMYNLVFAQTENEIIESKAESVAETQEEGADLSELTDSFVELAENPLNLNKADESQLRSSGLFNDHQVAAINAHRIRFGELLAVHELQVIDGFEPDFIRQIMPFITVGRSIDDPNAGLRRMLKEGKHSIILRTQLTPEKKRGYLDEGSGPMYAGDPFGLLFKYRFRFMNKLSASLVAEKDPGEQFFSGSQKQGFDFYSGHIALNRMGIFRQIVIGDYQLAYGQGLTLMTSLSGGKAADPMMIKLNSQGIKPYSSTGESAFKRGLAVSVTGKKFVGDLFLSHRKLDANLNLMNDTLESADSFTSLQQSGFHRTESEIADRHAVTELMFGGNIRYVKRNFRSGITAYQTSFDLPLQKDKEPYNQFEFTGKRHAAIGWDYTLLYRNISFFGETTTGTGGKLATLHGAVVSADPKFGFAVLYRNYPVRFQTLYSGAFREGSRNQNERGVYAGFSFRPVRAWMILASADRFYFPWLRYRVDKPGGGYEWRVQVNYIPSRKSEIGIRFRKSEKLQNTSLDDRDTDYPVPVNQHGIRIHYSSKVSNTITLRTRVELTGYFKDGSSSRGFMVYQDVLYHPMGSPLKGNIRFAVFDTDSYDSRTYAYENDVLYGYSIPAYYYNGMRLYVNVRYKITKGMDVWIRYAATFYTNRETIGSGWEEISGSRKSDLKLQLRFEF